MRILVTGGSGFIGSAFTKSAVSRGFEVMALSRSMNVSSRFGERWIRGSISEPPWGEIERFAPDVCLHSAWIATPGVYLESEENAHWVNWSSTFINRMAAMGVRHIISLGTCIEYKMTGDRLREDESELAPASAYARSKHELRLRLQSLLAKTNVISTWARLFYPYGPGEHPARLMSWLVKKLVDGEKVQLRTPKSVKDYIHVSDVAEALLAVVSHPFNGIINIGTGEGVAVGSVALRTAALLDRRELVQIPEPRGADSDDFTVANNDRLRSLHWSPSVDLDAGLSQLIRNFRR